ncbi:hypothetical protein H2203_005799 [Taxawa tesnikishii (nom. ined.)]|nr:hypothetical protein H2203_005799 [Dothideales sp. JES 119]
MWPPPSSGTTPYGFQSAATPNSYLPPRGLFSPLASMIKGTNSPTASEGLPPPPNTYGEVPPYQTSLPMSAPASMASAHPGQQQTIGHAMMGGQPPVTQASPVSEQQPFVRPPPTPTYSYSSQTSSTQPSAYSYSSGPSPIQQSPISAGGPLSRMSPTNGQGPIPSLPPQGAPSPYNQQRPFSYPVSGPVLSNVSNPNGQLGLVGGMPPNMMQGFNSGHAAQIHHIYGHPQQPQPSPANDRPFKCDQCPQSFNRNHDLKRHKRIHLAVKPFPCGHCDKSFSRKDALKRHILVKGCGKAQAALDGDSAEGSISPVAKSEGMDASPVVAASA